MDYNKSSTVNIPAKIIKITKDEIVESVTNCINGSISADTFPDKLKIADIASVFKKGN